MRIDLNNYLEKDFECPDCLWKGKGKELENGESSELHSIYDFDCPKCFNHIGSGQAEIVDVDKYLKYLKGEVMDDFMTSNVYSDNDGKSVDFSTHKNEIKLEYRLTEKNIKILKTIIVNEADKVCLVYKCHRNDLIEKLLYSYYKKENAFFIFKKFLQKNKIKFITFDKVFQ